MNDLEKRRFRLHSRKKEYANRIERARRILQRIDEEFSAPSVHVSGGKDSLVLWHLAVETGVDWPVFHFDNGWLNVPGVTEFVKRVGEKWGDLELYIRTTEAVNDDRMVDEEGHGYNGYWGTYKNLARAKGFDCRVLGIRGEESVERRDRFQGDWIPKDDAEPPEVAVAPIHHLKTEDIWGYIVNNELEYHDIYDEQGELYGGIDARENRLVTMYDSEFESLGAREISQFVFPGETNRVKAVEQSTSTSTSSSSSNSNSSCGSGSGSS